MTRVGPLRVGGCPRPAPSPSSPPDQRAEVLEEVGAAIDGIGGRFTMHYTTVAIMAARAPRKPAGDTNT